MDLIEQSKELVVKLAIEDREQYSKFLNLAKEFAIKNNIYILETFKKTDLDSYKYQFYSVNAFRKSSELCDEFYKLDPVLARYAKVLTKIKYYMFSIVVNERELIIMINLHYNLTKIVMPVYKDDLLYLGSDISNVVILEKLCSPANYKDWDKLIDEIDVKIKIDYDCESKPELTSNYETKLDYVQKLIPLIEDSDFILIGSAAISDGYNRLQIITQIPFSSVVERIEKILDKITYNIVDLKFITDCRLKRMTVYCDEHAIMDVFNNGQYELVPYVKKGKIKIGSIFVLMRFRLIDFWTLKVLLSLEAINVKYARTMLKTIRTDYDKLNKYFMEKKQKLLTYEYQYGGVYDNIDLAIKRQSTEIIHPYYSLIKMGKN